MKAASTYALLLATAVGMSPLQAAAPDITAGEWELSVQMKMDGVPVGMPTMTFKSCLSPNNPVPLQPNAPDNSCKVIQQSVIGNTATWTVQCKDKNYLSEIRGKGTYRGTTMQAMQTTTMTAGGRTQTMAHTMTGKRIGPCPRK